MKPRQKDESPEFNLFSIAAISSMNIQQIVNIVSQKGAYI